MRETLLRQFDTAWKLAAYHLGGLTTEACLWRPAAAGLHVRRGADGLWRGEWPDRETYDLGPASIAWTTWHMIFWWSMALDHNFGPGVLVREDVTWPGEADAVRNKLHGLRDRWLAAIETVDLAASRASRWPMRDQSFGDVMAWANIELSKNAAEIGYARFLHAVR